MCGSCQDSLVQEVTQGNLFLRSLVESLQKAGLTDERFKVIVAQSGMTEYAAGGSRAQTLHVV